jgi:hypothetical protein
MNYREWKKIFKQSGEIAAVLIINDLSVAELVKVSKYHPAMMQYVQVDKLALSMLINMLKADPNSLKDINTAKIDHFVKCMLIDTLGVPIPHLDVSNMEFSEWRMLFVLHPKLIVYYQDAARASSMDVDRFVTEMLHDDHWREAFES